MKKRDLYKILFLICFWECCAVFIVYYDASLLGFKSEIEGAHYNFVIILISAFIICLIGATILGSLEVLFLGKLLRKKALGISLLIKTTTYLIFIIFFTSIVTLYLFGYETEKPMFSREVINIYVSTYLSARVFAVTIYWGVACMLALFILQINEKFGQGVLINFLLGKYHRPKEDKRIFMFMDLNSSTTYAEKLGHLKYSQLIQDCFFDLTEIVLSYDAKIYQYVGDEVVLSWNVDKRTNYDNCFRTFFAYDNLLQSKRAYYENKYGIVPVFKAGVNVGYVTVAEVGELKKELAYHGDAINTAARIQEQCNKFKSRLLISEEINNQLRDTSVFKSELIDKIRMKGKLRSINIYNITPCNKSSLGSSNINIKSEEN